MSYDADKEELFREAFNLLCGVKLGDGMSRDVYACTLLPGYVVKVERRCETWQNILEWQTWQMVKEAPASRWFAACRYISPDGRLLIQERTRPVMLHELPERIPVWFTDAKIQNWGAARTNPDGKGRPHCVCHDYGTSLVLQEGTITKRLKKADWWDAEEV